ncbi:hypothetical protein MTO96_045792 [Rhipicephalus appendiculatus]
MQRNKDSRGEGHKTMTDGKGPRPSTNTSLGPITKFLKNPPGSENKSQKKKAKKMEQKQSASNIESTNSREHSQELTPIEHPTTSEWDSTENDQEGQNGQKPATDENEGDVENPQMTPDEIQRTMDNCGEEDRTSLASFPVGRGERGTILSRLAKTDKTMMRALIKISALTAGNETVAQQLETLISEQAKLKAMVIEQAQEIAFQKGRIQELEKNKQETTREEKQEIIQGTPVSRDIRPTYAMVVSSGTLEKREVADILRRRVDPLELGIRDAAIRPGRQGIVVTTSSKEDSEKILRCIQNDQKMKDVEVKLPKETRIHVKIIGLEDDVDKEDLPARIVKQNHLRCSPDDIIIRKTWPGRRGQTIILALNRSAYRAIEGKVALNIGWSRCPLFDDIFVARCTRCADTWAHCR